MKKEEKREKNGFIDFLIGATAIFGGIWLISKIAEKERKYFYKCPKCSSDIEYKQDACNVCKSKLKWDF